MPGTIREIGKSVAEDAADSARLGGFGTSDSDHLTDPLLSDVKPTDAKAVHQKESKLDEMYSTARATNEYFYETIKGVAAKTGGKVHELPVAVKALPRVKDKIGSVGDDPDVSYGGVASRVTDLVRGTIVYDTVKGCEAALAHVELLAKKKNVKSVRGVPKKKDRFAAGGAGYKDINILITMGNGFQCELQLHVKAIATAKKEAGHAIYDVIRVMDKRTDLSADEARDLAEMQAFSDKVYKDAEDAAARGEDVGTDTVADWKGHPTMAMVQAYKKQLGV